MRVRDYVFVSEFINDYEVIKLIKSYIRDGKTRKKLPRKFNNTLPNVPYTLLPQKGCEYTVWVIIHYKGCNSLYVLPLGADCIGRPETSQRAICIKLNEDGVSWDLYQTNANNAKHRDVRDGIRTYLKHGV